MKKYISLVVIFMIFLSFNCVSAFGPGTLYNNYTYRPYTYIVGETFITPWTTTSVRGNRFSIGGFAWFYKKDYTNLSYDPYYNFNNTRAYSISNPDMNDAQSVVYIDYFEREELIIKNAIPTAEGVIEIALSEMPITLFESRVLVIGYGRVGKVIAEKFKALGSEVCVSARKCADFAWIKEKGMKAIHTESLENEVSKFDLVINTVPAKILDEKVLKNVRNDALILDVASKPGGVDFEVAKKLGKNVIWALSLPGKTAPITSGKIIKETIMNILSETEV